MLKGAEAPFDGGPSRRLLQVDTGCHKQKARPFVSSLVSPCVIARVLL